MNYNTEYIYKSLMQEPLRTELTAEMIPSLARAKTSRFLKKSISLSNSQSCSSCKKRIRKDLIFCPFCGKRNGYRPSWITIPEETCQKLNNLQNTIIFAPAGFKDDLFYPYNSIEGVSIQIAPIFNLMNVNITINDNGKINGFSLYSQDIIELFELINTVCSTRYVTTPSVYLKRYNSVNNTIFEKMSGVEFESYCVELLRALGYSNVKTTKASGDQGVDIVAEKNSIRYAVQCKCYNSPIGNAAIQEVFAGIRYYKCDTGIVITNSTFTRAAIELAGRCQIELWDGNTLEDKKKKAFLQGEKKADAVIARTIKLEEKKSIADLPNSVENQQQSKKEQVAETSKKQHVEYTDPDYIRYKKLESEWREKEFTYVRPKGNKTTVPVHLAKFDCLKAFDGRICSNSHGLFVLRKDGKVYYRGEDKVIAREIASWSDIVMIKRFNNSIVGLHADGGVYIANAFSPYEGQFILEKELQDLSFVDTAEDNEVSVICGITSYGTVITYKLQNDSVKKAFDTEAWRDIVVISCSTNHILGLCTDGTVVAAGDNTDGICDTSEWKTIIGVAADNHSSYGILANGHVISAGASISAREVNSWANIIHLSSDGVSIAGLTNDFYLYYGQQPCTEEINQLYGGSILIASSEMDGLYMLNKKSQLTFLTNDDTWDDLYGAAITAKPHPVLHSRRAFIDNALLPSDSQIEEIRRIRYSFLQNQGSFLNHHIEQNSIAMGFHKTILVSNQDTIRIFGEECLGTPYFALQRLQGVISVKAANRTAAVLCNDGTVYSAGTSYDVSTWEGIIQIAVGVNHIVGLKHDGTVLATGDNAFGQCNVNDWKNVVRVFAAYSKTICVTEDGTVFRTTKEGSEMLVSFEGALFIDESQYDTIAIMSDRSIQTIAHQPMIVDNVKGEAFLDYTMGFDINELGEKYRQGRLMFTYAEKESWKDLKKICSSFDCVVGLKENGEIIIHHYVDYCKHPELEIIIDDRKDYCDIVTDGEVIVGVKKDGSLRLFCSKKAKEEGVLRREEYKLQTQIVRR